MAEQSEGPDKELVLPPVQPPATKAPATFNQQVNVYQLPQSALDKLNGDQIFELSREMMLKMDSSDQRNFDFAVQDAQRSSTGRRIAIGVGSAVAIIGIAATTYLAANGHEMVALSISLPLGTILAMIVGNRFLG